MRIHDLSEYAPAASWQDPEMARLSELLLGFSQPPTSGQWLARSQDMRRFRQMIQSAEANANAIAHRLEEQEMGSTLDHLERLYLQSRPITDGVTWRQVESWNDKQSCTLALVGREGHPVLKIEAQLRLRSAGEYSYSCSVIGYHPTRVYMISELNGGLESIHKRMPASMKRLIKRSIMELRKQGVS